MQNSRQVPQVNTVKKKMPPKPCLVSVGDSWLTAGRYMLGIDEVIVCDDIPTLLLGLGKLFAAYYNFNISYPLEVTGLLEFIQRWRGSVYKMVWQDMLIYLILYYFISFIYRFALDGEHKSNFESLVIHCARFRNLIPVSFVLGFFVSLVVSRWWGVYQSLPWPDTLAILLATHIPATTAEARRVREIILRYINLTIALTFAMVSPVVKKKLPSLHHFHAAGYITEEEMRAWENLEENNSQHKTWVPVVWACRAVDEARKEQILNDTAHRILIGEILRLRGQCGSLMGWNEYNVPLVYTQVVTIAVYSYFFFSVLGEQFLDPNIAHPSHTIDLYVPVFALLQLFFYIGWIKVAEALLNPFGSDDHDFEFMPLLNRHKEMVVLLSEQSRGALTPKSPTDPSTNTQSLNLKYIDEPVHVYYDDDDDQDNNDGAGSGSVGNVIPEA